MSLLPECDSKVLATIRGASQSTDEFVRGSYARIARNCQFLLNQQVSNRPGLGVASVDGFSKSVTSMYNWILAASNRLAYYNKTDGAVSLSSLPGATINLLTGISGVQYADFASLGSRLAFALVNSAGGGQLQGRVWDSPTAPATADKAFEPPVSAMSVILSEPGAGTVSRGTHRFAIIFTTRTGYETRPSPVSASFASSGSIADLLTVSINASGNKTVRVAISPTGVWPASFVSAALLMTTVQNQARFFFVPGCTVAIGGGTSGSATFPDVNLSDTILASESSVEAITADKNYFALYSQDSSAAGPFNPFKVIGYSDRAVWFCTLSDGTSGIFVSNKNAAQWITLASHLIQLPGKLQITSGFVLKGSLYLLGPGWTYVVSDNTSLPVTWVPPQEVDGRIGTPHITGVAVNSSLGYAFVADTAGLQFFSGGAYAARPISYLNQPEWDRINWTAAAATVQVLDFPAAKMVLVMAPLDGATAATHILAWDYSNGISWDKVNYTIWDSTVAPDIGALANVYNSAAKIFEVYLSRYTAGKVYRTKSIAAGDATDADPTALYNDDSSGFTANYETCPLPDSSPVPRNFVALRARIRGNGTILQTARTSDQTRTASLPAIVTSLAPGRWALTLVDVQSETVTVSFSNNGVSGAWFLIAGLEPYYTPWLEQR